eukprot:scaffold71682_cov63-Phaeocystis_antarctica.AAC.4
MRVASPRVRTVSCAAASHSSCMMWWRKARPAGAQRAGEMGARSGAGPVAALPGQSCTRPAEAASLPPGADGGRLAAARADRPPPQSPATCSGTRQSRRARRPPPTAARARGCAG